MNNKLDKKIKLAPLINKIKRFFLAFETKEIVRTAAKSRFHYFLDDIDKNTDEYKDIKTAVLLCDNALDIAEKRVSLIEKLKNISESINELESYNQLDENNRQTLKILLERYSNLTKDRRTLIHQLSGFEKSLGFMQNLEDQAPSELNEIREAEEKQRIFKHDIAYLEAEKSDLIYERGNLELGISFIYKATIVLVIGLGISVIALVFLMMFKNINIFFPISIIVISVIILIALLYVLRRRMKYELELNAKKQNRAVELTNKKYVVFAHYTNFLNYEYRKFRIKNSSMLQDNIKEYELYKHLNKRLDAVRNISYQTEGEIEAFLKENKIPSENLSIERFTMTVDVDNKLSYYEELSGEKKRIEEMLSVLDTKHELIWDELLKLERSDVSSDRIIERIMKSYLDETSRILSEIMKNVNRVNDTLN